MKDKKGVCIVNAFQEILVDSNRKPKKIWVYKGTEFYNSYNFTIDIEMYSIHNEGKSVIAERFIRTLKNKIYKYMTSMSKNVYIDKVDDIVNEYNNTYHRTIKMKPVDLKDDTYIDFKKEVNDFCNTDQYWYYGEACSSRTNVCHRSYTSREPFSPLFRVCLVNVS